MTQQEVDRRSTTPRRELTWKRAGFFVAMAGSVAGGLIAADYALVTSPFIQALQTPGALEASRIPETTSWAMSRFWERTEIALLYPVSVGLIAGSVMVKKDSLLERVAGMFHKSVPPITELVRRSTEKHHKLSSLLRDAVQQMPLDPEGAIVSSRQNRFARYSLPSIFRI